MGRTALASEILEIEHLHPFGAEVKGLNLSAPLEQPIINALPIALSQFQLLVFRNQSITPEGQIRFTRYFGELEPGLAGRPSGHQVASNSNILYLSNEPGSPTSEYGMGWHSDGLAYAKIPHGATVLFCLAAPEDAGDTMFASQYQALDSMSEGFKSMIRGLYWLLPRIPHSEIPFGRGLAQPVLRRHPLTGREHVFCAPAACQIRGMTRIESAGVLGIIRYYQARDDIVHRHKWTAGDVVVWENCALLHTRADIADYRQGLRAMYRSATAGSHAAIECEPSEADSVGSISL